MTNIYEVALRGCDGTTYLKISLTPEQLALIQLMCEMSEAASESSCQPTMTVEGGDIPPKPPKDQPAPLYHEWLYGFTTEAYRAKMAELMAEPPDPVAPDDEPYVGDVLWT